MLLSPRLVTGFSQGVKNGVVRTRFGLYSLQDFPESKPSPVDVFHGPALDAMKIRNLLNLSKSSQVLVRKPHRLFHESMH
jgi:hypothetical protein